MPEKLISPVLVGRRRETEVLDRALRAAQDGAARVVLIAGEAGIGKSRLVAELLRHTTAGQFLVWEGHCFEQDSSFPFAPWIDALRGFLAPKSSGEIRQMLDELAPEFVKLLPELALLIPDLPPSPPLDAESEKRRLLEIVARFVARLAQVRPLLIVLEDLHWSDELSLELLRFVMSRIGGHPVLLVCTYRDDEVSERFSHYLAELNRSHLVEEIRLAPLARAEVEQMVRAILKTERSFAGAWFEVLVSLTEGNPFFVEEMLTSVIETGDRDNLQIPRSVQELVQGRVARLTESTHHVLVLAALIGERFDFALLQEITAEDEQSLLPQLKELTAAQLIVEQSADQFAFRHALTRQAVQATLMLRERKAMHQIIGRTLERSVGKSTDRAAALLAYHYYQGGVWEKALAYSQLAGEQAQALYAPHAALTHFTQALDATRHLAIPASLAALRGRARARELLADFDGARGDHEAALELAMAGKDRVSEWQALLDLGFLWQGRDLTRAGEYYQRALELAENLGDPSMLGQTLNRIGNWQMNLGGPREALPCHRQALALFRERDDLHGVAATLDLLGIVSYQLGEVVQGAASLEDAVSIFRKLDDRQGLVNALTNLAVRAHLDTEVLGNIDFEQLTQSSEEALRIARGIHWYQGEVLALLQGAFTLRQAGEYGRALEWLDEARPLVDEGGNLEALARFHLIVGETLIGLLALSEARQHLETALVHLQELGSQFLMIPAKGRLAWVALLENDLPRAQAILAPLLPAEYPDGHELAFQRSCWGVDAELELLEGHPSRALAILDRILASTANRAQYGAFAVPRLSRLHALARAAVERTGEAVGELQGALIVARTQGLRPLVWQIHADLGSLYQASGRRAEARREFSSARTLIQALADRAPKGPLRDNFLRQALQALPAPPATSPGKMAKAGFGGLTAREREIAALIAQGKSNREIAGALVISDTTAERHVANILSKLGFNSRTQVAIWAVEKGLGK